MIFLLLLIYIPSLFLGKFCHELTTTEKQLLLPRECSFWGTYKSKNKKVKLFRIIFIFLLK
jgi:hypothetical protein